MKIRLVENNILNINTNNIEYFEESKLVESSGNKYEALAIVKDVPVAGYDLNKNQRKYPKQLWEKLLKENAAEGTLCMVNHPKEEADLEKVWGVWHNMKVNEKAVTADLYLIDEKPVKILKAGSSKLGTSSSGWGEIEEDGQTVNPETYVLERLADLVVDPSQGTYISHESIEKDSKKESVEIIKDDSNFTNKYIEENKKEKLDNNDKEVILMSEKFHAANIRNLAEATIEKYDALSEVNDIKKAIDKLSNFDSAGLTDVETKVQNTIKSMEEKIENIQKSEIETTKAKLVESTKELEDIKPKYEKAKAIIEKIGLSEDTNIEELVENYDSFKEAKEKMDEMTKLFENDSFKEYEIDSMDNFSELVEDTIKRDYDIECLLEDRQSMEEDINFLKNNLIEAEKAIVEREEKLIELGFEFEEAKKSDKKEEEDEEEKDDDSEEEEIKEKKSKKKEMDDEEKDDEEMKEEDPKDDEEKEEKKVEKKKESYQPYRIQGLSFMEEKIEESKKSDIEKLYEAQVEKYPALADIEEDILKAEDVVSAVSLIDAFKEKTKEVKSDVTQITEEKENKNDIKPYKVQW